MNAPLLSSSAVDQVIGRLRERGVLGPGPVAVSSLTGGVSSDVLSLHQDTRALVAKTALAELKVLEPWHADPARVLAEALAMQVASSIRPENVPQVIDLDEERHTLVMSHAPSTFRTWKDDLLAGRIRTDVAAALGTALADWHSATYAGQGLDRRLLDLTTFEALRIDPFYNAVASMHPDLAGPIAALVDQLTSHPHPQALVHGDFSPKNILVGNTGVWVLDWEVAHLGAPILDLAFLISHLSLKAVHLQAHAEKYREAAAAFLAAYRDTARPELADIDDRRVSAHVGVLLLARVDGTSPVDYLDEPGRAVARALGRRILQNPTSALAAWEQQ